MNNKLKRKCDALGISEDAFAFLDSMNLEPGSSVLEKVAELDYDYTYKPPESDAQVASFEVVRKAYKQLAILIVLRSPAGHHQSLALEELEKSCAMAMGAIALDWIEPGDASG